MAIFITCSGLADQFGGFTEYRLSQLGFHRDREWESFMVIFERGIGHQAGDYTDGASQDLS